MDRLKALTKEHFELELGEEQKAALLQVFQCIDTKLPLITSIIGPAGTGKSTIIKLIVAYLDEIHRPYVLASPTHKANAILAKFTNKPVITWHNLLGIAANIDVIDLNYNNLQFISKGESKIPLDGVLIMEECSMLNKTLFTHVIERAAEQNCMIIFVGDLQQLRPVKENSISKSFTHSYPFELSQIFRQKENNPLLELLNVLRTKPIYEFTDSTSEYGSLIKYSDWRDLLNCNKHLFQTAIETNNPDFVKLIAYTNNRVSAFNRVLRKRLFPTSSEYNVGDFLMGYDTIADSQKKGKYLIINSSDYQIKKAQPHLKNMLGYTYNGWLLDLQSFAEDKISTIFILSKNNPIPKFQHLAQELENLRIQAVNTTKSNRNLYTKRWKAYFNLWDAFLTPIDLKIGARNVRKKSLDFGYCITAHKAQGSNFDHLLVDMKNILLCTDVKELQQLQYVALSRTRKNIHMLI